ncbi:MAG: hypothetical protein HFJ21_05450 [Clostridia bacterium]|nr:hypothetical protein [Clostridia bacterium]
MLLCSMITDDIEIDGVGTAILCVLLAVMVAAAVAVNVVPRIVHKWEIEYKTRDLTVGATCLAIAFALSWATLFRMPNGGRVTPGALAPLFIYCYYFGFRKGMIVCTAYTLLQFLQGASIVSPWSAFFDYILPYFAVCLVGLFAYKPDRYAAFVRKNKDKRGVGAVKTWAFTVSGHYGVFVGAVVHMTVRYLSQCVSSMLFWAYGAPPAEAFTVGLAYNSYGLVDSAIAVAALVMLLSSRAFNAYMSQSTGGKKHAVAVTAADCGTAELAAAAIESDTAAASDVDAAMQNETEK